MAQEEFGAADKVRFTLGEMVDSGWVASSGRQTGKWVFLPLVCERPDAACPDLESYGRAGSGGLGCGLVGDDGLAPTSPECGQDDCRCQEA